MVWRRFSLILALLGALALGGTGYASDVGPDAAAPSDMTQMLDHDCCPQGSGLEDVGAAERGQPCNGMDACSGNPCGLAGFGIRFAEGLPVEAWPDLVLAWMARGGFLTE